MLKEYNRSFRVTLACMDMTLVVASFFAGYSLQLWLAQLPGFEFLGQLYSLRTYYKLIPFTMVVWGAALFFVGAYDVFRGRSYGSILLQIIKASFIVLSSYSIVSFTLKFYYISRSLIWMVFAITAVALFAERFLLLKLLRSLRSRGLNYRSVLVVGTGRRPQSFIRMVDRHKEWGMKIAGIVDDDPALVGSEVQGYKVLGTLNEIPDIITDRIIDDVMFIVPRTWIPKIETPMLHCEQVGKRVTVACDYFNMKFAKAHHTDLSGFPLMTFETTSDKHIQLIFKRLLDIAVCSINLVLLAPVFACVALLVKISSPGPILFKQIRSGLNGRRFYLYKFRTMVVDAESRLAALRAQSEMSGPAFKMTQDPRVTPIGKFLRKFSLDELPQLWNVLKGDMSMVGPRPPIPSEVARYEPWQRRRLSMRPGLTCIWQVSGRNKIRDFDEWMRLDLQYIDNWSLGLDLFLFIKTIPVVLFAVGAK